MNKTICKIISLFLACMMLFGIMSSVSYAAGEFENTNSIVFNVKTVSETTDSLVLDIELVSGSFVCAEFTASTSARLTCTEIAMCDNFIDFQQANGGISYETNLRTQKTAIISLTSYSKEGSIVRYSFSKDGKFAADQNDVKFTVSCCYDNIDDTDVELEPTVTSSLGTVHTHTSDGIWETVTEPTCQKKGTKVTHCTVCGEVAESKSIEKTDHKKQTVTVDATCTEDGYKRVICSECQTVLSETIIPATNHKNTRTVKKDATCTEDGYKKVVCLDCGETISNVTLTATDHLNTTTETKAPTCTEDGYEKTVCKDCNEVIGTKVIPATGHQNTEQITVLPTCTEDGYVRTVCKDCETVISETVIEATGHHTVLYKFPATCTEDGYIDSICTGCNKVFNHTVLEATGHKWSEWEVVKEPTYKTYGLKTRYCLNCNEYEEERIPMLAVEPTGITISMTDITMNYKKSTRLYANVLPEEAAYSSEIVWESSNTSVARVDQDGNVYAAGVGNATITASTADGSYSATCNVKVEYSFWQIIIVYVLFGWIWY